MRKIILTFLILLIMPASQAWDWNASFAKNCDMIAVRKLLQSQVKYANKTDFEKFIDTYDKNYVNGDGFDLDVYSKLVHDIWNTSDSIRYGIKIKSIDVNDNTATVNLSESSYAEVQGNDKLSGELKSQSESVYKLKKVNGKWKVVSDLALDEITYMLYGDAKNLDIKLTVPNNIYPETEYTATLEFEPPNGILAIASLAAEPVQYPQEPAKEVFRALPDDNILERLFIANNQKKNEYIVASIGLTKSEVSNLSIKLSLTGYGYAIRRVNVLKSEKNKDVQDK